MMAGKAQMSLTLPFDLLERHKVTEVKQKQNKTQHTTVNLILSKEKKFLFKATKTCY